MAIPEFRYRLNADANRWEVVQRTDGKDTVVQDYATADEAREHVVRAGETPGAPELPS
jgi:hypothetical protein